MQQLDIFEHSRDVMLRNDLLAALLAQDAEGSRKALQALADEAPEDAALADARVLVQQLERAAAAPALPFAEADEVAEAGAAAAHLAQQVAPQAERLLPRGTHAAWLAPHWAALARRAAGLPFSTDAPASHAAALWLRAEDGLAAERAVEGIESWRRIPQPLAWMTEARHRARGLDAAWPLWVELAWMSPRRFAELAAHVRHPLLARMMRRFEDEFEGEGDAEDWAWFPAWCLIDMPALAPVMDGATAAQPSAPASAWSLVQALLRMERQGRHHEIVKARQRLRDCHAGLFDGYMKTR